MEDINVMKSEHEARIDRLENDIQDSKGKLNCLVEINKEAMYNSVEGVKRVNDKISTQKTHMIRSDMSSDINLDKKNEDVQTSMGPSTKIRRK